MVIGRPKRGGRRTTGQILLCRNVVHELFMVWCHSKECVSHLTDQTLMCGKHKLKSYFLELSPVLLFILPLFFAGLVIRVSEDCHQP